MRMKVCGYLWRSLLCWRLAACSGQKEAGAERTAGQREARGCNRRPGSRRRTGRRSRERSRRIRRSRWRAIRTARSRTRTARRSENFVVDNGGLENVFVYVKDGLGDYGFDVPAEPVKLDQQGCRYRPHVLGIRVGQKLVITNSDDTLHNMHAMAKANGEWNKRAGDQEHERRDGRSRTAK